MLPLLYIPVSKLLAIAPLSRLKPPATVVRPHTEKISYLEIRQAYMGKCLQYVFFLMMPSIYVYLHIYTYILKVLYL